MIKTAKIRPTHIQDQYLMVRCLYVAVSQALHAEIKKFSKRKFFPGINS